MKTAEELTTLFRERGLRVTPQRQAIFRLLHGDVRHPTVDSLFDSARAEMPTMSLKTVYQTVHDLENLGQVRVLDLGTGSLRVDPNVEADHHHLICTRCGAVRDVPLRSVPSLPSAAATTFSVDAVEVIFRGVCDSCSRSEDNHKGAQ